MPEYPSGVYSPRTKENKTGVSYDAGETTKIFAEDVVKLDDEVVAIETELGAEPKGDAADVAERLDNMDAWNGKKTIENIMSYSYEYELETTGEVLSYPNGNSGSLLPQAPEFAPKPCHLDKITYHANNLPSVGPEYSIVMKIDGVNAHTPAQFTTGGSQTLEVALDVTLDGTEIITYAAFYADEYGYELFNGTITIEGNWNKGQILIEFIDDEVDALNNKKLTTVNGFSATKYNSNVLSDVSGSNFVLKKFRHYIVEIFLAGTIYGSSDIQWKVVSDQSNISYGKRDGEAVTTAAHKFGDVEQILISATSQQFADKIVYGVRTQDNDANCKIQFAQVTAQTNTSSILTHSFIRITDIGSAL